MITIKEKLKAEIDGITDEKFLEMIVDVIGNHQSTGVYQLYKNERRVIQSSRDQILRGEVFSNDEIKEMSKEWIG